MERFEKLENAMFRLMARAEIWHMLAFAILRSTKKHVRGLWS
jgi:hypothetical protein